FFGHVICFSLLPARRCRDWCLGRAGELFVRPQRREAMRMLLFACIALVAVCPTASRADDDAKKKAELKWARGVADDFLAAMKRGETESAVGLLTAEYAKLIAGKGSAAAGLDRLLGTTAFTFEKATVTDESISPDRDEVQLKGELVR